MDKEYYSEKIINKFVRKDICQNDRALYRYYEQGDVKRFRNRLRILKVDQKAIEKIIYIYVTDSIRGVILDFIGKLSKFMKPMGDLIISGGEAFNTYFNNNDRIITSDIDTKFIPIMKTKDGHIIGPMNHKFFGYLQIIKLILWNYLGKNCKIIEDKIIKKLKRNKISKMFGIHLPSNGPYVTRRYTLIRKMKQSNNSSLNVKEGDVLIDVELFALDLNLRYYSIEKNRIETNVLGGILDIAFMRPFEFGYEVIYSQEKGMYYRDSRNQVVFNPDISYAGKKFLVEDLHVLRSLGLRPGKKDKDKKRMYDFSKKVLGINSISSNSSNSEIFKKAMKKVSNIQYTFEIKDRPIFFPNKYLKLATKINPYAYEKYTTKPEKKKVVTQFMYGVKGPRSISFPGIKKTSGPFRFNVNSEKWVQDKSSKYIKNEYNFRLNKKFVDDKKNISNISKIILYGYLPQRDNWVPKTILKKSSLIPFIGLKK